MIEQQIFQQHSKRSTVELTAYVLALQRALYLCLVKRGPLHELGLRI